MKPHIQYKPTGLPWVTEMPAHWELVRNKAVLSETKAVVGSRFADYDLLSLTKKGVVVRDISSGKGKFPKDFTTYKEVSEGQIIFCLFDVDETPRTVGISHTNGMITGAYDVFTISDVNPEFFLYYYITMDNTKALKPLYTSLRKVINVQTFLQTKTPLPPRDEQDQIMRWLDWRTSRINKLVRSKRREIECLKELKQSVISKTVTVGFNLDAPTKVVKSYFEREVPKHWREANLKRILRKLNRTYGADAELLICSNKGTVFPRGDSKMGLVSDSDAFYQGVKSGDLLIHGMDTWHGAIAVSNLDGKCTGVVHVCDSNQNKRFVMYYLQMLAFRKLYKAITNGVRQNTSDYRSWDKAGSIEIVLPPKDEQDEIADFLDAKCTAIDRLIIKLHSEIDLVLEYKTRIISDAVTGKIDLRNVGIPNYEAVEEESAIEDEDEETEEGTGDEDN